MPRGSTRAGNMTASRNRSAAASTVASCRRSLVPNSVATPLLLTLAAVARRPIDSPSSPSTDARSAALVSTMRREASPLTRRPSISFMVCILRTIVRIVYVRPFVLIERDARETPPDPEAVMHPATTALE